MPLHKRGNETGNRPLRVNTRGDVGTMSQQALEKAAEELQQKAEKWVKSAAGKKAVGGGVRIAEKVRSDARKAKQVSLALLHREMTVRGYPLRSRNP